MAVYFKFKSAKDYDSIPIDGHFISVGNLKEKIFESKHLGRGTDFDLVVTNAQTNEEYTDEATLIPKNTSVLIRRVPGRHRMPIVTAPAPEPAEQKVETKSEDVQTVKSGFMGLESSAMQYPEDSEWDEFGNDLYAIPEILPVQSNYPVQDNPPSNIADEASKIKALIDTPTLDWQSQPSDNFGPGRGFGRGMGGRVFGGRGFGRGGLERKTPPPGYICYRCKIPGHFIQHCPTNGDPNYDIKRVKPPTGIPKSMLMATPDGSYALPSGAVAVLKPNEAAFEKEIEGMPSTRSVGDLPPELHCPLCKEVMKDAVLTSKCCFTSFCDKCIRDYIISKSICVCGSTNILADDLLPNKTLRNTINRILESNNSSGEHVGSAMQVPDMESARNPPKFPSPTQSAASHQDPCPPPQRKEETSRVQETAEEVKAASGTQKILKKDTTPRVADISAATHESASVKEPVSQGSARMAEDEVQQKPSGDAGKKKKKKRPRFPLNAADMHFNAAPDLAAEAAYMMGMGPSAYNPYWGGMQPGMEAFAGPMAGPVPYMGYGVGPFDVPFGNFMPQAPYGGQACMFPFAPPQRDLADFGMGFNGGAPMMSREEFEARKADLKRKRELERRNESREMPRDRDFGRETTSSGHVSSMKLKSKSIAPLPTSDDHLRHRHRPERPSPDRHSRETEPPRPPSKRKYDDHHDYPDRDNHHDDHSRRETHHHRPRTTGSSHRRTEPTTTSHKPSSAEQQLKYDAERKQKASVFSRISFPDGDIDPAKAAKKRKSTEETAARASSKHREDYKPLASRRSVEYESSDEDDRHFKRRPSGYESPPPAAAAMEVDDEKKRRRRSKERER